MLRIGITDIGHNGFTNHIMQSEVDSKKVITECENYIRMGFTFPQVLEQAYAAVNVKQNNLTLTDRKKVERKVEEIYESYHSRRQ